MPTEFGSTVPLAAVTDGEFCCLESLSEKPPVKVRFSVARAVACSSVPSHAIIRPVDNKGEIAERTRVEQPVLHVGPILVVESAVHGQTCG